MQTQITGTNPHLPGRLQMYEQMYKGMINLSLMNDFRSTQNKNRLPGLYLGGGIMQNFWLFPCTFL